MVAVGGVLVWLVVFSAMGVNRSQRLVLGLLCLVPGYCVGGAVELSGVLAFFARRDSLLRHLFGPEDRRKMVGYHDHDVKGR